MHKAGADAFNVGRLADSQFAKDIESWTEELRLPNYRCAKQQCCHNFIWSLERPFYLVKKQEVIKVAHRSICGIMYLHKNKIVKCGSGILLSKNIVLTAALNCFDKKINSEHTNFKIYFGEKDGMTSKYFEV